MSSKLAAFSMYAPVNRLLEHLHSPLFRNGYALVFNAAATSALGLIYWMLAARYYASETVGINTALINAMTFLSSVAQLNMANGFNRILPTAGTRTLRVIAIVYVLTLIATPVLCLVYFAGVEQWSPTLHTIFSDWQIRLLFVVATMIWGIFALQDSALVGLRQAIWIPAENLLFSVGKLLLLLLLINLLPMLGIFVSWVIPMALLLLPVNWLIFRRLAPAHMQATRRNTQSEAEEQLSLRAIVRYVGGDYLSVLVWTGTIGLLPALILERYGASATAYFGMAWTIAYSLYQISRNMGMSLVSEASRDQSRVRAYCLRTLVQSFKMLLPAALLVTVAAPWLLRIFGDTYSTEATLLLRLLALSSIPATITSLFGSMARVQRRLKALLLVQVAICGLVIGLTYFLLPTQGISAVGVAWLVAQTLVAFVLLASEFRILWVEPLNISRIIGAIRGRVVRWHSQRLLRRISPVLDRILHELDTELPLPAGDAWQALQLVPAANDITVLTLGGKKSGRQAMLKMPHSRASLVAFEHQYDTMARLQNDPRIGEWRKLLPALLRRGRMAAKSYIVEAIVQGQDGRAQLQDAHTRAQLIERAVASISMLHQQSAQVIEIDSGRLVKWIDEPLEELYALYRRRRVGTKFESQLVRLRQELYDSLHGRQLAVSWVHGDFTPGNILLDNTDGQISGIIDWELAAEEELPQLDLLLFLLAARMERTHEELGELVLEFLEENKWSEEELSILISAQQKLAGETPPLRTLLLLCWLRHVGKTMAKSMRYRNHPIWTRRNVDRVLQGI